MFGPAGATQLQNDLRILRLLHVLLGFLLKRKIAAPGQRLLGSTDSKYDFEFSRRRERGTQNG
jgi:hypothetical protein